MALKIDDRLNLVIPLALSGGDAYVHSTPISQETFDEHFMLLSRTFNTLFGEGFAATTGPRVAYLMMERVARNTRDGESFAAVMNEIYRLTMVALPGGEFMLLDEAIKAAKIDQADKREIDNALVFFTVTSALLKPKDANEMISEGARLWGALTTSLGFMAYVASLSTSTGGASSGETAPSGQPAAPAPETGRISSLPS